MSGPGAGLPPLHERASRQVARLVNARGDLLVLGVAGSEASLQHFEADLAPRVAAKRSLVHVDLAPEEAAVWSAILERARAAGDPARVLLSVRLVGGAEGRGAQLNLGREVRQAYGLAVILWVDDEDQLDRLRNAAPDLWAHRSYVVLLLEWLDHAKEPPRDEGPALQALITERRAEIARRRPDDPLRLADLNELMRLCFHAGEITETRRLLREVEDAVVALGAVEPSLIDALAPNRPQMRVFLLLHEGRANAALDLAERMMGDLRALGMSFSSNLLLSTTGGLLRSRQRHREAVAIFCEAANEGDALGGRWNASLDRVASAREYLLLGDLEAVDASLAHISRTLHAEDSTSDTERAQRAEIEAAVLSIGAMLSWFRGEPLDAVVDVARGQTRAARVGVHALAIAQGARGQQLSVELGSPSPVYDPRAPREMVSLVETQSFEWRALPLRLFVRQTRALDDGVVRRLRQQQRKLDAHGAPDARIRSREVLAWIAWCQGRHDEARRDLRWLLRGAGPPWGPIRRAKIHAALARVELSDRRPHDALAHVAEGEREHAHEPEAYRSRFVARDLTVARAEALLQLERVADARDVLLAGRAALLAEGLVLPSFDLEHMLLTLPLADDAAERRRAAEGVWAAAQRSGALWFEARALLDLAWIRRASGEVVDALLDEAVWVFERFEDDEQLERARSLYAR